MAGGSPCLVPEFAMWTSVQSELVGTAEPPADGGAAPAPVALRPRTFVTYVPTRQVPAEV